MICYDRAQLVLFQQGVGGSNPSYGTRDFNELDEIALWPCFPASRWGSIWEATWNSCEPSRPPVAGSRTRRFLRDLALRHRRLHRRAARGGRRWSGKRRRSPNFAPCRGLRRSNAYDRPVFLVSLLRVGGLPGRGVPADQPDAPIGRAPFAPVRELCGLRRGIRG